MFVLTGAVDLHCLISSMKTSNPFAMITSTSSVIQCYLCVTSSLAKPFSKCQVLIGEKEFPVQTIIDGTETVLGKAQHLRDGLLHVKGAIDAPVINIPWTKANMSHHHHHLNMLLLCDCLRKCYDDHLRYR
jgi:hypothetical protein